MNYQLIDGILIVFLGVNCLILYSKNSSLKKHIAKLEKTNNIEVREPETLK